MPDVINEKEYAASIKNRRSVQLTGVSEVLACDAQCIGADTAGGKLALYGSNMKILAFDQKTGVLTVSGEIDSLIYSKKADKEGGLFKRILK